MAEAEPEKERKRSPNYPSASLRVAVEKIRVLYKEDKGAATAPEIMAKHWNTSIKSSSFLQTVGALRKYGLITDIDGPTKKMKLTNTAMEIVMLPEADPKHVAALKRAALKPKLFNDLWSQYGPNLPSDDTLAHELVSAQNFLVDTAIDVIKQYKKNIEFAKLSDSDKMSAGDEESRPKIGDFIQWESQGMLQFPEPKRVVAISDDGTHLRVEGSMTGIPVEQARVESPPKGSDAGIPAPLRAPPKPQGYTPPVFSTLGSKQDTFTLDSGSVIVQWPQALTEVEFEDVEQWMEILLRKIKRSVQSGSVVTPNHNRKDDGPAKIEMNPR